MIATTRTGSHLVGNARHGLVRSLVGIAVFLSCSIHLCGAEERATTRILDDGTTIVRTLDSHGRIVREEVILSNGRHKTTYFDQHGDPKYAVVYTATGSFGMMYYEQADAPLFKFWDHGNHDYRIQTYSETFEKIGALRINSINGARTVAWEPQNDGKDRRNRRDWILPFVGLIIGALIGYPTGRRVRSK